jgi:rhodanese-related sulfurtransferase
MSERTPGSPLPRPAATLVAEAEAVIETIPVPAARALLDDPGVLFVDIRDPRELERDGMLPGAFPAPRGMLEFWIDPQSPYYKPALDDGRTLVLYCGGAWRSALAARTLNEMGRTDVAHLEGGFAAWKAAGMPIVPHSPRPHSPRPHSPRPRTTG